MHSLNPAILFDTGSVVERVNRENLADLVDRHRSLRCYGSLVLLLG